VFQKNKLAPSSEKKGKMEAAVSSEHWYMATKLNGATSQKVETTIITAVGNLNFIQAHNKVNR
jgi:hypothetical protein